MSEKTDVIALHLRLAHMQTLQSRLPHIFGNQACITSIESLVHTAMKSLLAKTYLPRLLQAPIAWL